MDDIFELTEIEEDMFDRLKLRIPYSQIIYGNEKQWKNIIEDLIVTARFKALSLIYPFDDYASKEVPKKYILWQYKCCIELYNLADKIGFSGYGENGLSWSKLTDGLSKELVTEITSRVGVPKKEEVDG